MKQNATNNIDCYIKTKLKEFKLVDMRKHYEEQIQIAINQELSYRDFLLNLLKLEAEGKKMRRIEKYVKQAHFENIMTIDNFDFEFQKDLNKQLIKDFSTLSFLERNENILLIGPAGVGKTHIATAIGIKACENGYKVKYATAFELMNELFESYKEDRFKEEFNKINKVKLLIIDELGVFKMNKEKESIFFQLIRQRYEKSSLIITTSLPLGNWDEIFNSKIAATAVLDRLVHHSHVVSISGDSYRVKGF